MAISGTTPQTGLSVQERLRALGYLTAEPTRTEKEAEQWFRTLHGIAEDESGDADFARILFDDEEVLPAPGKIDEITPANLQHTTCACARGQGHRNAQWLAHQLVGPA